MAKGTKTREINLVEETGAFKTFFKKMTGEHHDDYDFEGMHALRKLLSNEKARILHVIKSQNPSSIYDLSKLLKRDFKSVSEDVKLLERFGFIDLIAEKTGKRERLKPILAAESIRINITF